MIEQLQEEIDMLSTDSSVYERCLAFAELCRRRGSFDIGIAQNLLAEIQFERLIKCIESNNDSSINEQLKTLDKLFNDMAKLDIERRTKKIFVSGEIVQADSQKVKDEYIAKWGEKTANILNNPDSRRRVMNVLEKFRAGANGVVAEILKTQEVIEEKK